jgi:serine/threonine-protein kinase RIO1
MSGKVQTSLKHTLCKIESMQNAITKDKNDRATVDQVLDPRTLIILHKLIQNLKIN